MKYVYKLTFSFETPITDDAYARQQIKCVQDHLIIFEGLKLEKETLNQSGCSENILKREKTNDSDN